MSNATKLKINTKPALHGEFFFSGAVSVGLAVWKYSYYSTTGLVH